MKWSLNVSLKYLTPLAALKGSPSRSPLYISASPTSRFFSVGPRFSASSTVRSNQSSINSSCLNQVVISLSCSPTPRQKLAWKVALSTFQQFHHVPPRLMYLRQVMCPSCFPSQMKNLGMTVEFDPKGDKFSCSALGLYSSPDEHSTM